MVIYRSVFENAFFRAVHAVGMIFRAHSDSFFREGVHYDRGYDNCRRRGV